MGVLLYGKMKLLLLPVLAAVALAGQADYAKLQFAQFKEQFGKVYKTRTEHQMRFDIFQANLKKIEEHNKSGASWKKGINQFSDLTEMIESYAGIATGSTPELSSQQVSSCTPNPLSCGG